MKSIFRIPFIAITALVALFLASPADARDRHRHSNKHRHSSHRHHSHHSHHHHVSYRFCGDHCHHHAHRWGSCYICPGHR